MLAITMDEWIDLGFKRILVTPVVMAGLVVTLWRALTWIGRQANWISPGKLSMPVAHKAKSE